MPDEFQDLIDRIVDSAGEYLPQIAGALAILVVGWIVARLVSRLVRVAVGKTGVNDRITGWLTQEPGASEPRVDRWIGTAVFYLIMLMVVIGALNALSLEALTEPTSEMLDTILQAIPAILAAAIVLLLAYVVGRIVATLVTSVLAGLGFNNLAGRLGLATGDSADGTTPSVLVGYLILALFMVVAVMAAASLLEFDAFSELVSRLLVFASQIIFGLIILIVGILLASFAARLIQASNVSLAGLWAMAARIAILFLFGAIALRAMGFANEIIILAFALPLAAVSVAMAIAFGVGGRDIAARELDNLIQSIRSRRS